MRSFLRRVHHALGPLAAGIMIDVLDLATFGLVGVMTGALVGGYAGWVIGEFEGLERDNRLALACCAAIYMMIPMTEPIPIATAFTILARFLNGPRESREDPDERRSE